MKRKIVLCLLSLLLVVTVPLAATASSVDEQGPIGKPNVSGVPIVTPKPQVTPIPVYPYEMSEKCINRVRNRIKRCLNFRDHPIDTKGGNLS